MKTLLTTLFALYTFTISARAAGPILSARQTEAAIQEGSRYKTVDKFLEKGLRGKRVQLASAMAVDGISKYATFFNDWQAIAAESARASQQMRNLSVADVESRGLLHVFVEVHAMGAIPTSKLDRRYREQQAHLVLKIGDRVIQPVEEHMIMKSDQGIGMLLAGVKSGKITLNFAFDLAPEDDLRAVEVILIDGDGHRHHQKTNLSGILNID